MIGGCLISMTKGRLVSLIGRKGFPMSDEVLSEVAASNTGEKYPRWLRYLSAGFVLIAGIYLCLLWVASYNRDNYDDKAVHYYCAARLCANVQEVKAIEKARPIWVAKLPSDKQFRHEFRLSSSMLYLLPSLVFRVACEKYRTSCGPPSSFSLPFRNASFLLNVFGLLLICILSFRYPVPGVVAMICLLVSSFDFAIPRLLQVGRNAGNYGWSFLYYGPWGSAHLVLFAAFFAYVMQQWIVMAICLMLIPVWHVGCGALWVPMALASFGLGKLCVHPHRRVGGIVIGGLFILMCVISFLAGYIRSLWVLPVIVFMCSFFSRFPWASAILAFSASFLACMPFGWFMSVVWLLLGWAGYSEQNLITGLMIISMLAIVGLYILRTERMRKIAFGILFACCLAITPFLILHVDGQLLWLFLVFGYVVLNGERIPEPITTVITITASYLYLSQLLIVASRISGVMDWLVLHTGNELLPLVSERLEGTRHVAIVVLLVMLAVSAAYLLARRPISAKRQIAILIVAGMVLLTVSFHLHQGDLLAALAGRCAFFTENDRHIHRIPVTCETLHTLDPNRDAEFFSSLGDFLILGANEVQHNSWSDEAETQPLQGGIIHGDCNQERPTDGWGR